MTNEKLNSEELLIETSPLELETKKSRKVSHHCCSACVIKCEQLQEQVDALTKKLKEAEEESKKLNSLLRLANEQNLQAAHHLKEMNVNIEEVFITPPNDV